MKKPKTEDQAQQIVDNLKSTGDLVTFAEQLCEKTSHYSRISGTVRYMFQNKLLQELRKASLSAAAKPRV